MMRILRASLLAAISVVDGALLLWGHPGGLPDSKAQHSLEATKASAEEAAAAVAGKGERAEAKGGNADSPAKERGPDVLVITVPHREQSEERMRRLAPLLQSFNLTFDVVDGPNMEKYCPEDINDITESKEAGRKLLMKEWHGRMPSLSTYDLQLFQIATLVGHMRAWQRVADTGKAATILEDDASIPSGEDLKFDVRNAGLQGADVSLLDPRHCSSERPPYLSRGASGMTGYWIDAKAARAFLANFPINIPIDWGVNDVLNNDVKAVCSPHGPVKEYGGEHYARRHSSYHSCGRTVFLETKHVVSSFLKAHVKRTWSKQLRAETEAAAL